MPGLGQGFNGKLIKAVLFFSLAGAGTYYSFDGYKGVRNAYDKYLAAFETAPADVEALYNKYEEMYYLNQYLITALIVFWVYNTLDAFFDAHFLNLDMDLKQKRFDIFLETRF